MLYMANTPQLLAALMLLLSLIGCDAPQPGKLYLPQGSPTQSVDAALLFNEANKLRSTDKEQAIELFTLAIGADAEFAEAYYNRGLTYAELKNIEKAEEDLASLKRLGSDKSETLEKLIAVVRDFYQVE